MVLVLRLHKARMTRDVDLQIQSNAERVLRELRIAGQLDLGDFMTFEVELDAKQPTLMGDDELYGGRRFRVVANLAAKIYGSRFGVDVALGGRPILPTESILGDDLFGFAGYPQ